MQLMDSLGNVNNAINILCYWIFDSNDEQAIFLTRESLDLICSNSIGEEQVVKFETVFLAVKYMWVSGDLKIR